MSACNPSPDDRRGKPDHKNDDDQGDDDQGDDAATTGIGGDQASNAASSAGAIYLY